MGPAHEKPDSANLAKQQTPINVSPPQNKTKRLVASMEFSGPVPPPAFLEQYERISPGLASRMVSMAEAESVHRRQIESSVVESHCQDQRAFHSEVLRGQILATAITVVALVAGAYTAVSGHEWAGGVLGCAGIGGIAINLILGRNAKQESAPKPDAQPAAPKGRHRKA